MQNASRLVLHLAEAARRRRPLGGHQRPEGARTARGEEEERRGRRAPAPPHPAVRRNAQRRQGAQVPERNRTAGTARPAAAAQSPPREACAEFVLEQRKADVLPEAGLAPRNRVLLTEPPGNGNPSLAEAIAAALGRPFYSVGYDTLTGSYLGETGNRLRLVLDYVASHECIVLLDEFEAIGKEHDDRHEVGQMKRTVASLLVQLERMPPSTVVVATTNHPSMLGPGHVAAVPDHAGARRTGQDEAGRAPRVASPESAEAATRPGRGRGHTRRSQLRRGGRVLRRPRAPATAASRTGRGGPVRATAGPMGCRTQEAPATHPVGTGRRRMTAVN